jgi:hypothetical protein
MSCPHVNTALHSTRLYCTCTSKSQKTPLEPTNTEKAPAGDTQRRRLKRLMMGRPPPELGPRRESHSLGGAALPCPPPLAPPPEAIEPTTDTYMGSRVSIKMPKNLIFTHKKKSFKLYEMFRNGKQIFDHFYFKSYLNILR